MVTDSVQRYSSPLFQKRSSNFQIHLKEEPIKSIKFYMYLLLTKPLQEKKSI